jgi:hypothetical protein
MRTEAKLAARAAVPQEIAKRRRTASGSSGFRRAFSAAACAAASANTVAVPSDRPTVSPELPQTETSASTAAAPVTVTAPAASKRARR